MTLLQKIQNLKWTPDLPYKIKEILLELLGLTQNANYIYSIDETLTNRTWIDGKSIYRRVIRGQAILDDLEIQFNYDIDNLIKVEGFIKLDNSIIDEQMEVRLPYNFNNDKIEFNRIGAVPYINISNGNNTFSTSFLNTYTVILEYTKTTN